MRDTLLVVNRVLFCILVYGGCSFVNSIPVPMSVPAFQTAGMQNAANGRTRLRRRAVFTQHGPSQPDRVSSIPFDPHTIKALVTSASTRFEQLVMVVCIEEVFLFFEHKTGRAPFSSLARSTPRWALSDL
ncbi:hypothetical protein F5888DRAFT_1721469 [Russula emetica]|nr:hypothetical protein F5888DRAFT_1721469 [Russula emetica]